jgi:hypothetical protein
MRAGSFVNCRSNGSFSIVKVHECQIEWQKSKKGSVADAAGGVNRDSRAQQGASNLGLGRREISGLLPVLKSLGLVRAIAKRLICGMATTA